MFPSIAPFNNIFPQTRLPAVDILCNSSPTWDHPTRPQPARGNPRAAWADALVVLGQRRTERVGSPGDTARDRSVKWCVLLWLVAAGFRRATPSRRAPRAPTLADALYLLWPSRHRSRPVATPPPRSAPPAGFPGHRRVSSTSRRIQTSPADSVMRKGGPASPAVPTTKPPTREKRGGGDEHGIRSAADLVPEPDVRHYLRTARPHGPQLQHGGGRDHPRQPLDRRATDRHSADRQPLDRPHHHHARAVDPRAGVRRRRRHQPRRPSRRPTGRPATGSCAPASSSST